MVDAGHGFSSGFSGRVSFAGLLVPAPRARVSVGRVLVGFHSVSAQLQQSFFLEVAMLEPRAVPVVSLRIVNPVEDPEGAEAQRAKGKGRKHGSESAVPADRDSGSLPLEQAYFLPRAGRLVVPLAEPVREAAKMLREVLHDFLQAHLPRAARRAPVPISFTEAPEESTSIEGLVTACESTGRVLEAVFRMDKDRTPLGISVRTLAHQLESSIELFLNEVQESVDARGCISSRDLRSLFKPMVALKAQCGEQIQQLDGMIAEITASLAAGK